ncbi:hypothetical protein HYW82_03375 [Candidatus Peregrinibacteria bacterium]|nr:hypothetical protein [Candidatus Peregrinibacteria bacterium]
MIEEELKNEYGWAIICYLPVVNIVTCVLTAVKMVRNPFCVFHARQGLGLFALWFFTIIIALASPILSLILWVVLLFLHGAGMALAYTGQQVKIPVVGYLAMKIPETYIYTLLTGKLP